MLIVPLVTFRCVRQVLCILCVVFMCCDRIFCISNNVLTDSCRDNPFWCPIIGKHSDPGNNDRSSLVLWTWRSFILHPPPPPQPSQLPPWDYLQYFFFFFFPFIWWKLQSPQWRLWYNVSPPGYRRACRLRECDLARFPFPVAHREDRTAADVRLSDSWYCKGTALYGLSDTGNIDRSILVLCTWNSCIVLCTWNSCIPPPPSPTLPSHPHPASQLSPWDYLQGNIWGIWLQKK